MMPEDRPEEDDEWEIGDRIDRLEEIAEILEEGAIGLEDAKRLREEADEHLKSLRDDLDVGDGDIIELESTHGER